MTGGPQIIDSEAGLLALSGWRSPKPRTLRLDLPGLPAQARIAAEARLARLLSACGCNEGAVGLMVGLCPAALVLWIAPQDWGRFQSWGSAVGILVAAMLLGKAVGLLRARAALRTEIARILAVRSTTLTENAD